MDHSDLARVGIARDSELVRQIEAQAKKELDEEFFRSRVEALKDTLRERRMRPWWKRLFPYRIHFERL